MKKKYRIDAVGCDDTTSVIMELMPEQFEIVFLLAETITAAANGMCKPTMEVREEP